MHPTPTPEGDPLRNMTIGGWEQEREVEDALRAFDPEGKFDVLVANYGRVWSFRPITVRAATWLQEYNDGAEVDPVFGWYSLPVPAEDAVELIDGLLDAGFRLV